MLEERRGGRGEGGFFHANLELCHQRVAGVPGTAGELRHCLLMEKGVAGCTAGLGLGGTPRGGGGYGTGCPRETMEAALGGGPFSAGVNFSVVKHAAETEGGRCDGQRADTPTRDRGRQGPTAAGRRWVRRLVAQ